MLSRHSQLFASAVFVVDGLLVAAAWLAAYYLRFTLLGLPVPLGVPPLSLYLWFGAVMVPFSLLVLRSMRIYRSSRTARLGEELFALVKGTVAVVAVAGLVSFFSRGELSRIMLAVFGVVMALFLCGSRALTRVTLRALRRSGRNLRHIVIVGTGVSAQGFARRLIGHPDFGLAIEGFVTPAASAVGETIEGHPVLGSISELRSLVEARGIDLVYLALARAEWQAEEEALDQLADSTAAVRLVPDLARAFTLNSTVEDFDGMPVVRVTETPDQGWNGVLKRSFDLVCSGLGLLLISPVLALVALWVKLDSPGPVFYGQERVGFNGRRFLMWKFRTMGQDAESTGPGWTRPDDPRRTGAGALLRKLSIDELPQLWNVFKGEMSLVGQRPERPMYVEQFRTSIPRYMLRHHVKAGITGWAQVNGLRGDTPLDQRIEYDLYYIRNWSLGFDVAILFRTLGRVFRDASAH
ncbi:MAG: undecaprenyl-phosphate glucose phosphotransferase [Candidatus Eisenbacteria bacterium]